MAKTKSNPEELIANIPDPETVRTLLKETIQLSGLLRSLLRVAERKAKSLPRQSKEVADAHD